MSVKRIACEVYSRVVGYFRPVANWNKGKQAEFADRKPYTIPADLQETQPEGAAEEP